MEHRGTGVRTVECKRCKRRKRRLSRYDVAHWTVVLRSLLLVVLFPLLSSPIQAAEAPDAALVMGGSSWYPPFHYPLEAGTPGQGPEAAGFDVAVAEHIATGMGRTITFRFDNWTDVLLGLEAGNLNLVPMFVSEQRRQRFLFSDPYNVEYHQLFGLASQVAQQGIEGLGGFTVAMEEAAYAAELLAEASPAARVLMADSEAEALRMVSRGEADYALIPAQVAYYTLQTEALSNVVGLSPPLLPVPYAFAVNRGEPELVVAINARLQDLQRDGSLRNLREAWLYPSVQPEPASSGRTWLWPAALVLLVLLFAWAYLGHIKQLQRRFDAQSRALEVAQEQLRALRLTDHLSGLMTRQYFLNQLEERLRGRTPEQGELALGMILIRDMGAIEQSLGPAVVDQLIARLARQLEQQRIGEIGYFGSSRFIVMLDAAGNDSGAVDGMRKLLGVIGRDQVVDGAAIRLHPLAGMSTWPRDGGDAAALVRNTMIALNQAWSDNCTLLEYDDNQDPDPGNYQLAAELRQAISNGDLTWVLQPQYDIRTSTIIGAEMLVRWEHPEMGMVPPDLFIPLAEEQSDLIQGLTRQAVTRAVAILEEWQRVGRRLQLSVNVSPLDLADLDFVAEILQLAGSHAKLLTLEITEAAVAQNGSLLREGVARLKQAGIRVSLDDYGTGYASLTHLKELNFDELKLDRSFIASISSNERLLRLTRASILLGLELGCQIVAEGVEDAQTAVLLRDQGCYLLQGYLVSRPLSLATFNKFIDMPLAFEGHPFNRWSEPASLTSNGS